ALIRGLSQSAWMLNRARGPDDLGLAQRDPWRAQMRTLSRPSRRTTATTAGRARNALFGVLALSLSLIGGAPASAIELPRGELKVSLSSTPPNTLVLRWTGPVMAPPAHHIPDALEGRQGQARPVLPP